MGPTLIFDKSALQGLSVDESMWLENFFITNITPLFFVETLADLEKEVRAGRTPEDIVGNIALKTPDMSCANNRSGAHVSTPLNFPSRISLRSSTNTGRWPESFAECDSRRMSPISSPSRSAIFSISFTWLSMESTCCSSDSVDFLA